MIYIDLYRFRYIYIVVFAPQKKKDNKTPVSSPTSWIPGQIRTAGE